MIECGEFFCFDIEFENRARPAQRGRAAVQVCSGCIEHQCGHWITAIPITGERINLGKFAVGRIDLEQRTIAAGPVRAAIRGGAVQHAIGTAGNAGHGIGAICAIEGMQGRFQASTAVERKHGTVPVCRLAVGGAVKHNLRRQRHLGTGIAFRGTEIILKTGLHRPRARAGRGSRAG